MRLFPVLRAPLFFCLLLLAGLTFTWGSPPPEGQKGLRILLIGLDGADWQIIDPLIEQGRMPNIARLRKTGAWTTLRSEHPMLSPLLWTSIATGKSPAEHGIIDFLVMDPATRKKVPIASVYRKTPALWNIYAEAGLEADFIGWWATWPAETINGHMVSDRLAFSLFGYDTRPEDRLGLVFPESYLDKAASLRVEDDAITLETLDRFAPFTEADLQAARSRLDSEDRGYDDRLNHLVRILASTRTYHSIALDLLRNNDADLLSVYYQGIDEVSHRFAQFFPPRLEWVDPEEFARFSQVVSRYYEYQDSLIGELLEAAGPGMTTVIVSDHGFRSGSIRPDFPPDIEEKAGSWHRLYGIVLLSGPGIAPGEIEPAGLYDITPTLLYMSGLPVAADMEGRPLMDAFEAGFKEKHPLATIDTYETGENVAAGHGALPSSAAVDAEIMARLRSLGYIGGSDLLDGGDAPDVTMSNMYNSASVKFEEGDLPGAEQDLRMILSRVPDHADSHALLSEVLRAGGNPQEALREARTALNLMKPPDEALIARFAHLSRELDKLEDARQYFVRATQLNPRKAEPWVGLGMVQSLSEDYTAAERSYLRALDIDSSSHAAVTGLHNVYERGGRSPETLARLEEVVRDNPDSAAHHTMLGLVYYKEPRLDAAGKEMRRALDIEPDSDTALAGLADILTAIGNLDEARAVLERAVARGAAGPETRMALGRVYLRLRRIGEATREMNEAIRLDPSNAAAHAQLGVILTMQRQQSRAASHMEQALFYDPGLYEVRLHLAVTYHELKQMDACEQTLLDAARHRPEDPEPYRLLESLYRETGRSEEANRALSKLEELEKAATSPPSTPR